MAEKPFKNPRGYVQEDINEALDWLNADGESFRRIDGTVVSYTNPDGEEFFFKQEEVEVVIQRVIDNTIKEKNINLYDDINKTFRNFVDRNIEDLEKRTKEYFYKRIDEVAEKIAVDMLNHRIEEAVTKKVEAKIKLMEKEIAKILKSK